MFFKSVASRLGALITGAVMLGAATTAQATLIGDPSVTFEVDIFTPQAVSDSETFGPIVPGPDHSFFIADGGAFFVEIDVESEHIFLTVTNVTQITVPGVTGEFRFLDLDWVDLPGVITGFDAVTGFDGTSGPAVIDNGHGIELGFSEASFDPQEVINIEIWLDVVHVPEPGTLALFGLGLAGLGLARRRKAV